MVVRAWKEARMTVSATASWISSADWRNWRHLAEARGAGDDVFET